MVNDGTPRAQGPTAPISIHHVHHRYKSQAPSTIMDHDYPLQWPLTTRGCSGSHQPPIQPTFHKQFEASSAPDSSSQTINHSNQHASWWTIFGGWKVSQLFLEKTCWMSIGSTSFTLFWLLFLPLGMILNRFGYVHCFHPILVDGFYHFDVVSNHGSTLQTSSTSNYDKDAQRWISLCHH